MTAQNLGDDIAARHAIASLHASYAQCIDAGELERWHEYFTSDGVYRVTSRENHEAGLPLSLIYCRGHGMMKDRITAMRTANIFEPHVYCHLDGALMIERTDGGWRTTSNFTIMRTMGGGTMSVFACGRFCDEIVAESGALKLRERIVVLDSRQIDTLLVIPL